MSSLLRTTCVHSFHQLVHPSSTPGLRSMHGLRFNTAWKRQDRRLPLPINSPKHSQSRTSSTTISPSAKAPRSQKKWTQSDLDLLEYMKQQKTPISYIATQLDRSVSSVKAEINQGPRLGRTRKGKEWTVAELEKLVELKQQDMPIKTIARELDRSVRSVYYRIGSPQFHNPSFQITWTPKPWTRHDMGVLAEHISLKTPTHQIAFDMGRTLTSVERRMRDFAGDKVPKGHGGIPFSKQEDEKLLQLGASRNTWKAVAQQMPGRRPDSLCRRYWRLKWMADCPNTPRDYVKEYWTEEEDAMTRKLATEGLSNREIGRALNRTPRAVRERRAKMDPDFQRTVFPWTPEETEIVTTLRSQKTQWKVVAMSLGSHRTWRAAQKYYHNVIKKGHFRPLTDQKTVVSSTKSPCPPPSRHSPTVTLTSISGKRGYATKRAPRATSTRKVWTLEDVETLARMKMDGRSGAEIAQHLGRTVNSVWAAVGRISGGTQSFHRRRFLPADDEKLERLRDSGTPWRTITSQFVGHSISALQHRYARLKQGNGTSHEVLCMSWTREDDDQLHEYRRQGLKPKDIATAMNRTPAAVARRHPRMRTRQRPAQPRSRWSTADSHTLYRMKADGVPVGKIVGMLEAPRSVRAVHSQWLRIRDQVE